MRRASSRTTETQTGGRAQRVEQGQERSAKVVKECTLVIRKLESGKKIKD